jgi:hypothetical protein
VKKLVYEVETYGSELCLRTPELPLFGCLDFFSAVCGIPYKDEVRGKLEIEFDCANPNVMIDLIHHSVREISEVFGPSNKHHCIVYSAAIEEIKKFRKQYPWATTIAVRFTFIPEQL